MQRMQGLSIACSTPEALAWDPEWADTHEISGRAMRAVHEAGEAFSFQKRQPSLPDDAAPSRAANGPVPDSKAHGHGLPNGVVKAQVAPLQHAAPEQQQQQPPQAAAQPLRKGVMDAAKANGIHVTAG